MQRILITGSSRGIGYALVNEYLSHKNTRIFATCRDPESATDLIRLAQSHADRLEIIPLDVSDESSITAAAQTVQSMVDGLDVLINNAGISPSVGTREIGSLDAAAISHVISTNAVSATIVTQAFYELLKRGSNPRVVMISSRMGSIELASGSSLAYRMSKSAMNMAAKVLSQQMRSQGITVITTHPGHVVTDMGGSSAPVKPAVSAAGLAAVIDQLTPAQTGKYFNYTGEEIPW